jgi:hypothetical protein
MKNQVLGGLEEFGGGIGRGLPSVVGLHRWKNVGFCVANLPTSSL